ncbi:MAG: C_GCAxxG_C_C family protein [Actinobacteria bacterium]|nr:C_GCAxxG_C_C family protein [Actinomycetota bacterium]
MEVTNEKFSRRKFLTSTGTLAAGLAIGGGLFAGGCSSNGGSTKTATAPKWPWPYQKLDPEVVRKKGYEGWYEAACSYGAFNAIISELRDKIGDPYTTFPVDMFRFGEGGVAGWSSLCGTLLGSSAAINLVSGKESYSQLINELMGYYSETTFPTNKHDEYAKIQGQAQSVSGSPLCHVSVTNWCKASGKKSFSPDRDDRCAKLTGDVAAYAVELLNKQADGKFTSAFTLSSVVQTCRSCHDKGGQLENTRGMMDCVQCHEPHNQ